MLNVDRVTQMTRMAMYEKNEYKNYIGVINYDRKSYISMRTLVGFITGTIFFLVVYGAVCAGILFFLLDNLNLFTMSVLGIGGMILYVLYIYIHLVRIRMKAKRQYKKGQIKLQKVRREYEILNDLYASED